MKSVEGRAWRASEGLDPAKSGRLREPLDWRESGHPVRRPWRLATSHPGSARPARLPRLGRDPTRVQPERRTAPELRWLASLKFTPRELGLDVQIFFPYRPSTAVLKSASMPSSDYNLDDARTPTGALVVGIFVGIFLGMKLWTWTFMGDWSPAMRSFVCFIVVPFASAAVLVLIRKKLWRA